MGLASRWVRFEDLPFGSIRIDGVTHEHDVVIDREDIRKRKKKASKKFRDAFGHTPLSLREVPTPGSWYRRLRRTPSDGRREARGRRREIELLILPTVEAIEALQQDSDNTNAILHVTD